MNQNRANLVAQPNPVHPELLQLEALSPEAIAQIPAYLEKWQQIALSTDRVELEQVASILKAAQQLPDNPSKKAKTPKIRAFASPMAAMKAYSPDVASPTLLAEFQTQSLVQHPSWEAVKGQVSEELWQFLMERLHNELVRSLLVNYGDRLASTLADQLMPLHDFQLVSSFLDNRFCPEVWIPQISVLDFCISVLNCQHDPQRWQILQALVTQAGWIVPLPNLFLVCDRPTQLAFDPDHRLHAEGRAAIEFSDGFKVYAYHGVILPAQYGSVYPSQWRSQWLLEEKNAELRRVLIQGIGYARLCQELQARAIDSWQEYTLLAIEAEADVEPIYLLKMTCPSTSMIHAVRVPPNLATAREAIRWVNWDIDPEQFAVQT